MNSLPSSRINLLNPANMDESDIPDYSDNQRGQIIVEGQGDTSSHQSKVTLLKVLAVCAILFIMLLCAVIPSSFLMAKSAQLSSVKSQNTHLTNLNQFLQIQAANLSLSVNALSDEVVDMYDKLSLLRKRMKVAKNALLAYFDIHFISHGNKSVEYAKLDMGEVVEWNFADEICMSLQSELGYPDASIHSSISDLQTSCTGSIEENTPVHACWVGLTKQFSSDWQTSKGRKVNLKGLWADGQPADKPFYDCAYLLSGSLYSQLCAGNTSQNHSKIEVAAQFVCQDLV